MVTLINHPGLKVAYGIQIQTPSPSIGLAYLGGYLKSKGIPYHAIDGCGLGMDIIRPYKGNKDILIQGLTVGEIVDRIPVDTKIIGLTCLFSQCWSIVNEIGISIKEKFPSSFIIAGGEHPTATPETVLNSGIFDVVIYGEGEETLHELIIKIKNREEWKNIDGICYLNKNKALIKNNPRNRITNIDNFPYPDWDNWCIEEYIDCGQVTGINTGRSIPILGSRGCPYACTFCSNEEMWTRKYIMRSGKSIVDEMENFINKYNVNGFTFMDSTFIIDRKKTLDYSKELIKRDLKIKYQLPAGTRCEAFDLELAQSLDKSGLVNFSFAPESGDEYILDIIQKKIKIDDFIDAVKVVLKTNMTVGVFFVIGFPEDTIKSLKNSIKLIRNLALIGVHDVTVSKFTPYPGSPYYHQIYDLGEIEDDFTNYSKMINFYDIEGKSFCNSLNKKQLTRWMVWMFFNFYCISFIVRPWRFLNNVIFLFTKRIENTRYIRFISEMIFLRKRWKISSENY